MRFPMAWLRDARGSSAVEFAILAPVFLLLLTGMLAYGIYFGAAHSLQQLSADAARTAMAGLNQSERNQLVTAFLEDHAGNYTLIDPARLSASVGDRLGDPDHYQVTLLYDASELPIWNLYPPLPLPDAQMRYSSTIRRGGI